MLAKSAFVQYAFNAIMPSLMAAWAAGSLVSCPFMLAPSSGVPGACLVCACWYEYMVLMFVYLG